MFDPRSILLVIDRTKSNGRELLKGISSYGRVVKNLRFKIIDAEIATELKEHAFIKYVSQEAKGVSGIIMVESVYIDSLPDFGVPTILASASRGFAKGDYLIQVNNQMVAREAVKHLVSYGHSYFGYVGLQDFDWCNARFEHFKQIVENQCKGLRSFFYEPPGKYTMKEPFRAGMEKWLDSIPKPIGIFACSDFCGKHVIEACKRLDIKVPDEVSVLGVDNDDLICNFTTPTLSSINLKTRDCGFEAAKLLVKLMDGEKCPPATLHVEPGRISVRQSTDFIAVGDQSVAKALRFIRDNVMLPIQTEDVCDEVCCSRQFLYNKFKRHLKCSVHDYIRRCRIRKICELLIETNMTISEIAYKMHFPDPDHVSRYFKKQKGISPTQYRRDLRTERTG
ncbi:substrate-binding domain-containing protein [Sedimentisphaera salicampi]|uniref:substrate-binding domain-containing protein n=1 Tax=Sedimentisphaera salicampi TaxID=1941349 RepID=UPI000B9C0499|nr:substrate-binding domain-containing protein [Sedimentisphaera salicampi]OXU15646.1 Xylose operon regulatory protein [Sedimentisphaera salicampi]